MHKLVCAFVVRKPPKTGFLAQGPFDSSFMLMSDYIVKYAHIYYQIQYFLCKILFVSDEQIHIYS